MHVPKKYITECLAKGYENMLGEKPSTKLHSPLEHGDHPELDGTVLLDADGIQKYQSLTESLQWTISLGRFDIACVVMTMCVFRAAPRRDHLDRLKRIVGYLVKMQDFKIYFCTHKPDSSDVVKVPQDWYSVYGCK